MSIQRQVGFEMLTPGIDLVVGLAADFPCLPVAEKHTMTGKRSSDHDGQEMTLERRTCLSCAVATSTTGGR
jgi:hypothetical protein